MPPVNTPAAPSPTERRPLTPLSYLSSPAPDLASTLQSYATSADDAADEANTDFLRDSLNALDSVSQSAPAGQPSPRAYVDVQRDPRRSAQTPSRGHTAQNRHETADDLSRRERLQRVLSRLSRLHEPQASSNAAYSNRTPSPHRQQLYDWAPAYDERSEQNELHAILQELRRQQPETQPETLRFLNQSLVPAAQGSEMDISAETYEQRSERRRRERERAQSLRNRAVLQRARQESSPSATERMLRYLMERERSGMSEEEERARGTGWFRPSPRPGVEETGSAGGSRDTGLLPQRASEIRERDRSERIEAFRRGYLAENMPPRLPRISISTTVPSSSLSSSTASPFLEDALKYLGDLRCCTSYEEALAAAIDNNLATKEFFADKHDDFITSLDGLSQDFPAPSSWLQPGAIFEGHQHASSTSVNPAHHRQPSNSHTVEQINVNYRSLATLSNPERSGGFDATRPWLSHTIPPAPSTSNPLLTLKTPSSPNSNDNWPVRVTLHDIDWPTKTLSGTMQAYDVPQHPASLTPSRAKAGKKSAPITTYLEGHILDLHTHTFLTPSAHDRPVRGQTDTSRDNATPYTTLPSGPAFPSATPSLDAQNWLALPPFNDPSRFASPADLARALLSRSGLQALATEYVFMRWKERCFVHSKGDPCASSLCDQQTDQDRGHGLTISGFYYISLRRKDGEVEGLYFDPTSTPYQHLRLKGRAGGWGSWEFA